jgi:hypothetical protein
MNGTFGPYGLPEPTGRRGLPSKLLPLGCSQGGTGPRDMFEPCEPELARAGLLEDGSSFRS